MVQRLLRHVAPLLSLVLLLQVMLAPLHCLAMVRGGGFETILCSAEGMRVIHVDADGRAQPADDGSGGLCVVCAGVARAVPAQPETVAAPIALAQGPAWFAARATQLPPPARGPPYASRGPPRHA